MAIQSRADALAIKKEVTEGTPVFPSAGGDFIAPQDDLSLTPEFEVLENAERKNSLGKAKSILGAENPTATTSAYYRHSGVEGTAPAYGLLLEAALGAETTGIERDTIAASTTTVINVDTAEGAEFPLGRPVLIKDATNEFALRFSTGVETTDDFGLSFALDNAPGTGVLLGNPVWYSPTTTGHPSVTVSHFVGNTAAGALQAISGGRVTAVDLTADAAQLVNASYTIEGIKFFYDPIVIAAADTFLDFTDDGGTFAAQITAKTYQDPFEVAAALALAMNTVQTGETHTVTYSDTTGLFTIATTTSTIFSLLWSTGGNTANTVGDKIGFVVSSDDTGSTTYTSDNVQDFSTTVTPTFDASDPLAAKNNEIFVGTQSNNVCFEASTVSISLATPKRDIESICAESGRAGSVINERSVTVSITALLEDYQAEEFKQFRSNDEIRFQANFGTRTAGDWDAGFTAAVYLHTATITSFAVTDDDGLASITLELTSFINDSGDNEVFYGFT